MAQSDLPAKIADDFKNFVPAPVRKLWDGYSGAFDKAKAAVTKKPQPVNIKYAPNAEQLRQMQKEYPEKKPAKRKPARKR
jgi:hypothetical protein